MYCLVSSVTGTDASDMLILTSTVSVSGCEMVMTVVMVMLRLMRLGECLHHQCCGEFGSNA